MAFKIRKGLEEDRLDITPAEAEPIYVTDTKSVYIGDGVTAGGNVIAGVATPNDGELHLTPKTSSSGAVGTVYFDSDDEHLWVSTTA